VKYADGLVLLAREENVLQGMVIDQLKLEDAMEWKWMWKKKTKVMRISRQPSPMKIMIDQKHLGMWNISII
jgi:hypothetical protein